MFINYLRNHKICFKFQVVGAARRVELIEELAKTLGDKKGKLHGYKVDLSKEQEIRELFKWTTENLGPVHILINNAGNVLTFKFNTL